MSQPASSTNPKGPPPNETRTEHLARWAANLQFCDIPTDVVERTKELFLDWFGCTVAGRHHPAVSAIRQFAVQMGPSSGRSELVDGSIVSGTSPAFASLINGASSHVVEQDDLHNQSIMHPVGTPETRIFRLLPRQSAICFKNTRLTYSGNCYLSCRVSCGSRY